MNKVLNQVIEDYKVLYEREKEKRKEIQQENQQLKENYDRIYNENCKLREEHNITDISLLDENQQLKKQKDDVVEFTHKELDRFDCEGSMSISMRISYFKEDLLRMLGEIE